MRANYVLRPYRHGDAAQFAPREDFAAEHAQMGWPLRDGPMPGVSWTVEKDGEPIGCGGLSGHEGEEGRSDWAAAWAYLSPLHARDLAACESLAHRALEMAAGFGLRVETTARADNPAARRTLERLGFRYVRPADPRPGLPAYHLMRRVF